MKSKTIAIVGSLAALSFAATPVAAVAATHHQSAPTVRTDRSLETHDVRHADRTPDKSSVDRSADRCADALDG